MIVREFLTPVQAPVICAIDSLMADHENRFYVYVHRRKSDGRIFYVGKGCGPRSTIFNGRNKFWQAVAQKHGVIVEVVFSGLSDTCAAQKEIALIAMCRANSDPLTNLTDGGEGMSGYVYTDEHRQKLSLAGMGRKRSQDEIEKWRNSRAGWSHSEETKAKLSAVGTGKKRGPLTEDVKMKIAKSNTGKIRTEEQRRKASDARRGIPAKPEHVAKRVAALKALGYRHSDETRAKIGAANALALKGKPMLGHVKQMLVEMNTKKEPVLCIETGQVFHTAVEARDWCVSQGYKHATSGRIRQVCNGRGKSCYGHTWRFDGSKEECVSS